MYSLPSPASLTKWRETRKAACRPGCTHCIQLTRHQRNQLCPCSADSVQAAEKRPSHKKDGGRDPYHGREAVVYAEIVVQIVTHQQASQLHDLDAFLYFWHSALRHHKPQWIWRHATDRGWPEVSAELTSSLSGWLHGTCAALMASRIARHLYWSNINDVRVCDVTHNKQ